MGFLSKLLGNVIDNSSGKPPEAIEAIAALESIKQEFEASHSPIISGFDIINPIARNWIRENPDNFVKNMTARNTIPRGEALVLITYFAADLLISGNYHTYRGQLSMEGTGLRSAWEYAAKKLINMGVFPEEEINRVRQQLNDDIKAMG